MTEEQIVAVAKIVPKFTFGTHAHKMYQESHRDYCGRWPSRDCPFDEYYAVFYPSVRPNESFACLIRMPPGCVSVEFFDIPPARIDEVFGFISTCMHLDEKLVRGLVERLTLWLETGSLEEPAAVSEEQVMNHVYVLEVRSYLHPPFVDSAYRLRGVFDEYEIMKAAVRRCVTHPQDTYRVTTYAMNQLDTPLSTEAGYGSDFMG